jgi:uncharacterized protein (DUF305 family)
MSFPRTLLTTLAVVGSLLVAGCGSDDPDTASGASGNGVDRAFVADMTPHHESAIEMAKIAQQRGDSAFVKQLAEDIISSQSTEITTMRRVDAELDGAGVKASSLGVPAHMMGMDGSVASLKSADPFDEAFLKMMLPHHEGAVVMAKAELDKGKDPALKKLATQIISAQEREIAGMRKQLAKGDAKAAAPTS